MRGAFGLCAFLVIGGCAKKPPKAGDVCKIEDEGTVVCADPTTALRCVASRRVATPCRGTKGCVAGEAPTCDGSLARDGDRCVEESGYEAKLACSEDRGALLRCRGGRVELDLRCRGPKGCNPEASHLDGLIDFECDRTIGAVGDACNTRSYASESLGVCGVDGKSVIACDKDEKGKLVLSRVCGGPDGCKVGHLRDTSIPAPVCDRGVIVAGAACGKDDAAECSADGLALLTCDRASATYTSAACGKKERCVHEKGMLAWCRAN